MGTSVKIVNGADVFALDHEFYYSSRTHIDAGEYPQVHDFYELILVTDGELGMQIGSVLLTLPRGGLLLLRPGDIHTKLERGPSAHIDLAFPAFTVRQLFSYLYQSDAPLHELTGAPHPPFVMLTAGDTAAFQSRLARLNQLPPVAAEKNARLRALLPDLLFHCLNRPSEPDGAALPSDLTAWLASALEGLDDPVNLSQGLGYLAQQSGRSPEHICRCFRRYFGCTPSAYLNRRRLYCAVNLLTHTDLEIVDVVYESGFQSTNYFYHLFKRAFGMSPLQYKKLHLPRYL